MVLAEALARGLPIVSTSAGAIPGTVPRGRRAAGGARRSGALAAALRRVMTRARAEAGARHRRARRQGEAAELAGCRGCVRCRAGEGGPVSRFAEAWLALREPADHAARSRTLAARFAATQGPGPLVVDLGAGSGSNLRYLAPLLAPGQRWLLVDHDPVLLAAAAVSAGATGAAACRALDLARGLPAVPGMTGVAAAALLDLTSAAWLDELARWCGDRPVLMALSVDGRLAWQPADRRRRAIRQHFFAHQRADKGFGPALGPAAAAHLGAPARGGRPAGRAGAGRLAARPGRGAAARRDARGPPRGGRRDRRSGGLRTLGCAAAPPARRRRAAAHRRPCRPPGPARLGSPVGQAWRPACPT